MNEDDWLEGDDPHAMLEYLRGRASERKRRLFACHCCRQIWGMLDEEGRLAIEIAEGFARGRVPGTAVAEQRAMFSARLAAHEGGEFADEWLEAVVIAALDADAEAAARYAENLLSWEGYQSGPGPADHDASHFAAEESRRYQVGLLHELFGNPFRPPVIDPAWLAANDGAVSRLACAVDEEGTFDQLPYLADALEDAGCADQSVLDHCRRSGGHFRGCWLLDRLIDRA